MSSAYIFSVGEKKEKTQLKNKFNQRSEKEQGQIKNSQIGENNN